jgi:hypothetical protein
MTMEEWQVIFVIGLAGITCGAIILEDIFSINRFWIRRTRLHNPPSSKELIEAHNRHHQFYYKTYQRLFDNIYLIFFVFSFILGNCDYSRTCFFCMVILHCRLFEFIHQEVADVDSNLRPV